MCIKECLNLIIKNFKNPKEDYETIKNISKNLLSKCISNDYVERILDKIIYDIWYDITICTDLDNFNEDDIKLAIGRTLCDKLGIEY